MDKRMDRQTVIRMAGVASAAAFVGGKYLGDVAEARAMTSRFDTTLTLTNGLVNATGPTNFAADEARARIWAHVAQGSKVQTGATAWVKASTWSVRLSGPTLTPGPADAYGVAYVQNRDGSYEWYPWEVAVTLR
jgi:hypothetical protein